MQNTQTGDTVSQKSILNDQKCYNYFVRSRDNKLLGDIGFVDCQRNANSN